MFAVEPTPLKQVKAQTPPYLLLRSFRFDSHFNTQPITRFAGFKHLNSNRKIPPVCRSHEHAYYSSLFAQRLFYSCALARAVGWVIHKTALLTHLAKLARTSFGRFASAHSLVCFWRKMMPYHHVKSETHQHGIPRICTDALYRNQMSQNTSYWSPRSSHREMSGLEEGSFPIGCYFGVVCTHLWQIVLPAYHIVREPMWPSGKALGW